jgi:DNA-binding CsgD family transcriptional regulator
MSGTTTVRSVAARREDSRTAALSRSLLRAVDPAEVSPAKLASSMLDVLVEEIPSAGGALLLMHPQTGLFWTGAVAALPAASCHPFFSVEVTSDSPRAFRHLTVGSPATALSLRGEADDPLLTEVLAPHGYTDELRVVCRDAASAWGGVSLWRDRGTFGPEDERVLGAVADLIGRTLRDGVLRSLDQVVDVPESRGMVVVEAGVVVEVSVEGTTFLRELEDPGLEEYRHLDHLIALARTSPRFSTVVGTAEGGWLCAHGTPLTSGRVAIVISAATPADLLGARVAGAGLTGREVETTRLLCRGLSDNEIARELGISAHTVHDHVRAVRRKLGVRSRGEISALVFADRYLPDFLDSAEVTHTGT